MPSSSVTECGAVVGVVYSGILADLVSLMPPLPKGDDATNRTRPHCCHPHLARRSQRHAARLSICQLFGGVLSARRKRALCGIIGSYPAVRVGCALRDEVLRCLRITGQANFHTRDAEDGDRDSAAQGGTRGA